ncbi:MAG: type II secretion system protein [Alphaproteobacteria bacterium]
MKYKNLNSGFTLVELAVVMVIIGLLVGGVLKGQQMIHTARVNKTIRDIEGYNASFSIFYDRFRAYPGDYFFATTRIPGCNAASNCLNGNGNGAINGNSATIENPGWNQSIATWQEPFQAWKHLALTDIISGVDSSADIGNLGWGQSHPATPLGGGYELYYDPAVSATYYITAGSGHLIRMTYGGVTGTPIAQNGSSPLTPEEAFMIDSKLDDGNGYSGYMTIEDAGNVCVVDDGGEYNLQNDGKDCIAYYFLK